MAIGLPGDPVAPTTPGATVFGPDGIRTNEPMVGAFYKSLVQEIVKFFKTGVPPVAVAETLEIFCFHAGSGR